MVHIFQIIPVWFFRFVRPVSWFVWVRRFDCGEKLFWIVLFRCIQVRLFRVLSRRLIDRSCRCDRPWFTVGKGLLIEDYIARDDDGAAIFVPKSVTLRSDFIADEYHNFTLWSELVRSRVLVCVNECLASEYAEV